jgi:glycosyltransferase involved in cell wall biosynthesis
MKIDINSVSFIMPNYNTREFMLMAYHSIRKYYPTNEIFILDDGSTDDSWDWLVQQKLLDDNLRVWHRETGNEPIGHTVTYNLGIQACKGPLFSIFHSDMICGEGYLENLVKHWKPKTCICATRIEPEGIYPPGKEKILKPFGMNGYDFEREKFEAFVKEEQSASAGKTNPGFFAPWLMSKEDFVSLGGNDVKSFAPFPTEDDDWCLRMLLAGYSLIQSRDALVFHWISRGHRGWAKNGVGKDDSTFQFYRQRSLRNYLRKWGRWMKFDEYHHPITQKVYDVGFILRDVTTTAFLHAVEPWATGAVYIDNWEVGKRYIKEEQPTTNVDLSNRVFEAKFAEPFQPQHDVILEFSEKDFVQNGQESMTVLNNLNEMLGQVENNGTYEYGIFKLTTNTLTDLAPTLIKV